MNVTVRRRRKHNEVDFLFRKLSEPASQVHAVSHAYDQNTTA